MLSMSANQVKSFLFPLLIVCLALGSVSRVRSQEQPSNVKIKKVTAEADFELRGGKLFQTYCAVCHGKEGKGNGPAVPALKTPPPDLTLLAKNNGGKFPDMRVFQDLRDPTQAPHGSKDMPIWGELFRSTPPSTQGRDQARASSLTNYLKSIQAK